MNIKIGKRQLQGDVTIPASKSDVHRLLIAAALADAPTEILFQGYSEDIDATIRCIQELGAKVNRIEHGVQVIPIVKNEETALLDCGESGSTLRFLLPIAAALGKNTWIEGKGRLPERPISAITQTLREHGCTVSDDCLPLELSGKLLGGKFVLPANISSQFLTGFLFALPLLEQDSEMVLTTEIESKGYLDMTLDTLQTFGIKIQQTENGFFVSGKQQYHTPKQIQADGDWSNASFWLAAGAMINAITCHGLQQYSKQGDKAIADILQQFGAEIHITENAVTVKAKPLKCCRIDAAQIPDMVPILCMVAAVAEGKTEIYHAGRLRIKESDRLAAMADVLQKFGVTVEEYPDGICIYGGNRKQTETEININGHHDHRIVMAATIGAMAMQQNIVIEGAEAVAKSYPNFFAEFVKLGGDADVL